jgi:serine phosphatase RsbU (regulator of sigma subunit)
MADGKFITAWMGVYVQQTGLMESINFGHPAPIIMNRNTDEMRLLQKGGTILGFFDDHYLFETETTQLQPGDILLAYTDGVSEAADEHDNLYEETKLNDFLMAHKHLEPHTLLRHLQLDLRRFVKSENYDDDLTCLVLKCSGQPTMPKVDTEKVAATVV